MKTQTSFANTTCRKTGTGRLTACATKLLPLLLLLTQPAVVQGQSYTDSYGTWYYTTTNDTITVAGYTGPGSAVIIPSQINNLPVTSIGSYAFWECLLTSVTIPDSVITIGDDAFHGCYPLTSVTIPNSVTSIGDGAFSFCSRLTNVTIGSDVTNIGEGVFIYCPSLLAIDVNVDNNSFLSVDGVFFDKSQATLIQFPAGNGATSYTIPNSVTDIGDGAFNWCTSLTSVTIPQSVTSIGDSAFEACFSLTGVYFQGDAPMVGADVFDYSYMLVPTIFDPATVYYLPGTMGWSTNFAGLPTAVWQPQIQTADTSFGVNSNQFGFNVNWASGMTVVVKASRSLSGGTWTPLVLL